MLMVAIIDDNDASCLSIQSHARAGYSPSLPLQPLRELPESAVTIQKMESSNGLPADAQSG